MKYKLLFLLMILANVSFAQVKRYHTSITMGCNISNFTNRIGYYGDAHSEYFRNGMRIGFNTTGINLKYDFKDKIKLGLGLLYLNCGDRYVSNSNYLSSQTELHYSQESDDSKFKKAYILNYLEIPMCLYIVTNSKEDIESSLYIGYGIFLNLNSKLKFNYYDWAWDGQFMRSTDVDSKTDKIMFSPAKRFNNSIIVGYSKSYKRMGWDIRAEYLLSKIYRQSSMTTNHYTYHYNTNPDLEYGTLEIVKSNMETRMLILSTTFFIKLW